MGPGCAADAVSPWAVKPASLASKGPSSMRIRSIFRNYFGAIKLIRSRKTRPSVIINAKTVELRRRCLLDNFAGGLSSENRQRRVREQSDLFEHRSLVPVDMLMGNLAFPKFHNRNERYLDATIRGRDAGQHPGHLLRIA